MKNNLTGNHIIIRNLFKTNIKEITDHVIILKNCYINGKSFETILFEKFVRIK